MGKTVEYTLRAIPLGGFVAFPDDDPESEIPQDDPNLLKNRPVLDRALVISAGVVANVLLAYTILFTQVNTVGLLQQAYRPGVNVPGVIAQSAAERAGVLAGDVILAVDGEKIQASDSAVVELVDTIKGSVGHKIKFTVQRGPDLVDIDVLADKTSDGMGKIGVQLAPNSKPYRLRAANVVEAAQLASEEFGRLLGNVTDGLKQLVLNFSQAANKISGPVAIVAVGAEVARNDVSGLFQFAAIVNINLAVVNSLPLPALDGGYLALLLVEAVRGGRKLPNNLEQGIMSSGVLLLLAVGMLLIVRDTLDLGGLGGML
eukprot:jgi/Mesen1/2068/ME000150S01149